MAPLLAAWPWEALGNYKYGLYVPVVWGAWEAWWSRPLADNVCLHILALTAARLFVCQAWQMLTRMLPLIAHLQIRPQGLSYRQVDREYHCDNPHLLQALVLYAGHKWLGLFDHLPLWNARGLLITLLLHMGPAELLYYCFHRALHTKYLFSNYHKLHHESVTPEPSTAGTSTFLEQLGMAMVMGLVVVGSVLLGGSSLVNLYLYLLFFDTLRVYGHSSLEIIPLSVFRSFPLLRYVLYTPSYHTLHHESQDSNFCLFMPLYDYLGKTLNPRTVAFHAQVRHDSLKEHVPDFVFLLHAVDFTSALHVPFVFRAYASRPYKTNIILLPFVPVVLFVASAMWVWGTVFKCWNYYIRHYHHQIWVVPRFGFMYFLPFAHRNINSLIEKAILEADRLGVKVFSLAALNKNEALNGGGKLFVVKYPNLRVRVCHGNTLTAAVIIKEIPEHVTEVFLTGATSKLGRAIALYLCRKGIRVLMLTTSRKRFEVIVAEAPPDARGNLVQVTKHQAGKNCKTWIVGKWLHYSEQMLAPPGTHFHQFVVPPVISFRKDCSYGKLAAMRLPDDVRGLACCEYSLERNVVHACHAGGVVHLLEGWTHHEVGALDVDRIDIVWNAALRHGLSPA
ncbi:hypothetical protein L7F22_051412 [Adiantum nelumboides]|nr:hypothetical protein [Adiantum nelumboides]